MRQRIAALGARPEFWLLCLLLWISASACRSLGTPWGRIALTEALRWAIGIVLALSLSLGLPRRETATRLLVGISALITLACLFGASPSGIVGPYSDHQLCASALLVLLPIALAVALSARTPGWRWSAQILATVSLVCLALTRTRSAWVGALVLGLVFAALWVYRSGWRPRQKRLLVLPALAILGALIAFWVAAGSSNLGAPLAARAATFQVLDQDGSWQLRLATWRGTARMVIARPLVGWGVGRYPDSQWHWTHAGRALQPNERPSLSEQAHDFYGQTAAELGIVGLGLYCIALLAMMTQGVQRLHQLRGRAIDQNAMLLIAALSMLAGQGIDAIASPSWQFAEVSLLFWAVLGVGLAALRPELKTQPALLSHPLPRLARFSAVGLAAVFLVAQILPLGLLSPVEAYSSPSGWTYQSAPTLTPATMSVTSGQTVTYTLTAHYKDASGHTQNPDVSKDSTTVYTAFGATNGKDYSSYFHANVFTTPTLSSNMTINIAAYYYDTRLKPGVKNNASPTATLKVSP